MYRSERAVKCNKYDDVVRFEWDFGEGEARSVVGI